MVDELAVGDFVVRQRKLGAKETLTRSYDIVIAGLSWESRGPTALASLSDVAAPLTLFKFKSLSHEAEAAKIAQIDLYRALQPEIVVKDLESSIENEKNFVIIKMWLQDIYTKAGRPLSVLIDITCIPKTYVLYLVGLGFSEELVACIDCLYTPGKYDLMSDGPVVPLALTGPRSLLSEGEWHSRQIPYLEASEYIANDADLLVTLGGELGLSLPFIERFEPRRLSLICIEETSPSRNVPMLVSERMAYEELLRKRQPVPAAVDFRLAAAVFAARRRRAMTPIRRLAASSAMSSGL